LFEQQKPFMQIPSVPTDSLYKFMSITGLILLIFSLYLRNSDNHQENINNIYEQTVELSDDILNLKMIDSISSTEFFNNLANLNEQYKKKLIDTSELFRRYDYLMNMRLAHLQDSNFNSIGAKRKQVDENSKLVHKLNDKHSYFIAALDIFIFLGVSLTALGFSLWYVRIQRYQDYKLLSEIELTKDLKRLHYIDTNKVMTYILLIFVLVMACTFAIMLHNFYILHSALIITGLAILFSRFKKIKNKEPEK
jgi:hypothetical protein